MKEKQETYHTEKLTQMGIKTFEYFKEAVQFLEEGNQFEANMYKKSLDNITIELKQI